MRVLLTGSAGFIGRALVQTLREAGHEVRGFDRSAARNDSPGEHLPGDLRSGTDVRRAVAGVDALVHAGAIPSDRGGGSEDVYAVNVTGTLNVLQAAVEAGIDRVVYFSSVNSLGNFQGHRATSRFPIDDAYPRHPLSPYQLSKHLGEEACRSYSDRYGMTTISLRPVAVIDPKWRRRWPRRPMTPEREEWQRADYWSYVDLRDVCAAVERSLAVDLRRARNEAGIDGAGGGVLHDAFLLAAADTNADAPTGELLDRHYPEVPWPGVSRDDYLEGNPHRSLVDVSHAREILDWEPRHSWREEE